MALDAGAGAGTGEPASCCLLELRAAKSRPCCCGVKRKFGGKEPPVPVEAIVKGLSDG